ncbi:MAG: substrate-binding domain-containing protein [Pseudomonadota bacterium]|nr:substrate-binding domain-containing protein [Pseudomonadota bacterium]
MTWRIFALLYALAVANPLHATARDHIEIVGTGAALDIVQAVSTRFAGHTDHPAPRFQMTGTGMGFDAFCRGIGFEHPDLMISSRRIQPGELDTCLRNGVHEISEIEIARDALVLIGGAHTISTNFSRTQLFTALAEAVPQKNQWVSNPATHWNDIDPELDIGAIKIMGPPPGSPAEYQFLESLMAPGCFAHRLISGLSEAERYEACRTTRQGPAYRPGGRTEADIVEWLTANPDGLALVSYSAYRTASHQDFVLQRIDGSLPTAETIGNGQYPLIRPTLIYVKKRHVESVPGLQALLYALTGEVALGPEGYLSQTGLLPLDDIGRNRARDIAIGLIPLRHDRTR